MFHGCSEHSNIEETLSKYSRNIACRLGLIFLLIIITGQAWNDGTKDVEILVPLKHPCIFWRTLEMLLINCGTNLMLTY